MGTERIIKNHMDILWHEYTDAGAEERPVTEASLTEKAAADRPANGSPFGRAGTEGD